MVRWAPDHDGKVNAHKRGLGTARGDIYYQNRFNHRISSAEPFACVGKPGRDVRDQSAPTVVPQATLEAA